MPRTKFKKNGLKEIKGNNPIYHTVTKTTQCHTHVHDGGKSQGVQ